MYCIVSFLLNPSTHNLNGKEGFVFYCFLLAKLPIASPPRDITIQCRNGRKETLHSLLPL